VTDPEEAPPPAEPERVPRGARNPEPHRRQVDGLRGRTARRRAAAFQRAQARHRRHLAADADAHPARAGRDGLVVRTVYPTVPPRVEYRLTPLGRTLLEPALALAGWAERHRFRIQRARERFDASRGRQT